MTALTSTDQAVLTALRGRLAALQWTPPAGGAQSLFGSVQIFPQTDLLKAIRALIALQDRVALIVLTGEDWTTDSETGQHRKYRQARSVTLLLADRNWGADWQVAMLGRDTTPYACGALTMRRIVLEGDGTHPGVLEAPLTSRTWVEPVRGDFMSFSDGQTPGAVVAWSSDLTILGGSLQTNLPKTLLP